jgi:S-formylglutathione hydrolase
MSVSTKATIASFGGKLLKLTHKATTTNCEMSFNLYLPPQATKDHSYKAPVLIYLSGLTCTADNCSEKGFFQHGASKRGIAVLYPDTSPRKFSSTSVFVRIYAYTNGFHSLGTISRSFTDVPRNQF